MRFPSRSRRRRRYVGGSRLGWPSFSPFVHSLPGWRTCASLRERLQRSFLFSPIAALFALEKWNVMKRGRAPDYVCFRERPLRFLRILRLAAVGPRPVSRRSRPELSPNGTEMSPERRSHLRRAGRSWKWSTRLQGPHASRGVIWRATGAGDASLKTGAVARSIIAAL